MNKIHKIFKKMMLPLLATVVLCCTGMKVSAQTVTFKIISLSGVDGITTGPNSHIEWAGVVNGVTGLVTQPGATDPSGKGGYPAYYNAPVYYPEAQYNSVTNVFSGSPWNFATSQVAGSVTLIAFDNVAFDNVSAVRTLAHGITLHSGQAAFSNILIKNDITLSAALTIDTDSRAIAYRSIDVNEKYLEVNNTFRHFIIRGDNVDMTLDKITLRGRYLVKEPNSINPSTSGTTGGGINVISVAGSGQAFFENYYDVNFTLRGGTIRDCLAYGSMANGGGAIWSQGNLTVISTTITGNRSYNLGCYGAFGFTATTQSYAGGIHVYGTLTLNDVTTTENQASTGGGIYSKGGAISVTNSNISENKGGFGSGIYSSAGGDITVSEGSMINENKDSPGIRTAGSTYGDATVTINNSIVNGNFNTGIQSNGNVTISNNCTINNNSGGGVRSAGMVNNVANSTISGNTNSIGAGIYCTNPDGKLTVNNSTISYNIAQTTTYNGIGGGIYAANELEVNDTEITHNQANNSVYSVFYNGGSGMFTYAYPTGMGGGIFVGPMSYSTGNLSGPIPLPDDMNTAVEKLTLNNVTFSDNTGTSPYMEWTLNTASSNSSIQKYSQIHVDQVLSSVSFSEYAAGTPFTNAYNRYDVNFFTFSEEDDIPPDWWRLYNYITDPAGADTIIIHPANTLPGATDWLDSPNLTQHLVIQDAGHTNWIDAMTDIGHISVNRNITLRAYGSSTDTIYLHVEPDYDDRHFRMNQGSYIYTFAIEDGRVVIDGSVHGTNGTPKIAGGIDVNWFTEANLENARIQNCKGDMDSPGGGITNISYATLNLYNSIIQNCETTKPDGGGGITNGIDATLNLYDVIIRNNESIVVGPPYYPCSGGLYNNGGKVYLRGNTTIAGNVSSNNVNSSVAGGVWNDNNGEITMHDDASITGNECSYAGGGIYNNRGTFIMNDNASITNNDVGSSGKGGGIYNDQNAPCVVKMYDNSEISGNVAKHGGGVWSGASFEMHGGKISGNNVTSLGSGSGVHNVAAEFKMIDGEISGNTGAPGVFSNGFSGSPATFKMLGGKISGHNLPASGIGGGVSNDIYSTFYMSGGEISNNSAINGGGVFNGNDANFNMSENAVISGNTASRGGGVYNFDGGVLQLSDNAVISSNTATNNGGGIFTTDHTKVNIASTVTFSNNTATNAYWLELETNDALFYNPGTSITYGALKALHSTHFLTTTRSAPPTGNQNFFYLANNYDVNFVGNHNKNPETVLLDLKVFLEGVTQPGPVMTNYIQEHVQYFDQFSSPQLPVNYTFDGTTATCADINNPAGAAGKVVDWIIVEIWGNFEPHPVLAQFAYYDLYERQLLLLKPNGDIVDVNGNTPEFTPQTGDIQIVIKHRNHLAVMSNIIASFAAGPLSYDFSTALAQAYQIVSGTPPMTFLNNEVYGLWAGDLNTDGSIDGMDKTSFNIDFINSGILQGTYCPSDVNMDGDINSADAGIVNFNVLQSLVSPTVNFIKR